MQLNLSGIHHLTAVSANIRRNRHFYTQVLGMRLVKRSVNQDDTSAYHLFYADGAGTPGTDLTFFDWDLPPARPGTHSLTGTHLRVTGTAALEWWEQWLRRHGLTTAPIAERDGRPTLDFVDPEGLPLALVDDRGEGPGSVPWEQSPVPPSYQVRGLGPIMMSVPKLEPTARFLTGVLNMRPVRAYPHPEHPHNTVHVYEMGSGGPHAELHVAVQPEQPPARLGAGGVHHVAFRTPHEAAHQAWVETLSALGVRNSGKVDRYYFRSLYFREPNGVLFEIATDGPGFAVDEPPASLGERLALPPFLEPYRRRIEANLRPID